MTVTPRTLAIATVALTASFLAMDAVWLGAVGPHLYRPRIGQLLASDVDWTAALLFYVLYLLGLTAFVVLPSLSQARPGRALMKGGLFGLVAYGTYDLTNQATLAGWPWSITAADLAWGALASATSAWVAARLCIGSSMRDW